MNPYAWRKFFSGRLYWRFHVSQLLRDKSYKPGEIARVLHKVVRAEGGGQRRQYQNRRRRLRAAQGSKVGIEARTKLVSRRFRLCFFIHTRRRARSRLLQGRQLSGDCKAA